MRWSILALSLLCLWTADTDAGGKDEPKRTPEQVFQAALDAVKADDFRTFTKLTTKDSQTVMAGAFLVFGGAISEGIEKLPPEINIKEIKVVFKQYGLTEEKITPHVAIFKEMVGGDNKNIAQALLKAGKTVHNPVGFSADFLKALKKGLGTFSEMIREVFTKATISDVEIKENTARAKLSLGPPAAQGNIFFRQEEGAWRIDVLRMIEEQAAK